MQKQSFIGHEPTLTLYWWGAVVAGITAESVIGGHSGLDVFNLSELPLLAYPFPIIKNDTVNAGATNRST